MRTVRKVLFLGLGLLLLIPSLASSASLLGTRVGASAAAGAHALNNAATTFAMAPLNTGWSARFTANSTLDILAITVNWTAVTSAGVVAIRVETDDGLGDPSGTLYDAAATLTGQVPVVGTQTYTFAVAPTTGLTVGTMYHIVILTTTGGTTQTLNSYEPLSIPTSTPGAVMTAADGTTRSNFTVVSSSTPAIVVTRTGGIIQSFEMLCAPFAGAGTTNNLITTAGAAAKIITQGTINVVGYAIDHVGVTGTPAGDLRIRLFDSNDTVVTGSTVTIKKEVIVHARGMRVPVAAQMSIAAGTYRLVFDCASCASSSHCFFIRSVNAMNASAIPNATLDTTADVTATPPTWTPTTTAQVPAALLLDTITAPAASGGVIGG